MGWPPSPPHLGTLFPHPLEIPAGVSAGSGGIARGRREGVSGLSRRVHQAPAPCQRPRSLSRARHLARVEVASLLAGDPVRGHRGARTAAPVPGAEDHRDGSFPSIACDSAPPPGARSHSETRAAAVQAPTHSLAPTNRRSKAAIPTGPRGSKRAYMAFMKKPKTV